MAFCLELTHKKKGGKKIGKLGKVKVAASWAYKKQILASPGWV